MIKVKKASAGSGKTYTLAHTYIDLLKEAKSDFAYRNILAVTFTNKATAEMKERILKYLSEDPEMCKKLTLILHDYSAFSVSTIDKFFQRALKAFAREIGQVADYQVEIDRNALIEEAMDRILDSLTDEQAQEEIVNWLRENVAGKLESGEKPKVEDSLHDMGKKLKSDERLALRKEHGIGDEEFSKERLLRIQKSCRKIIKDFAAKVKAAAEELPEYPGKTADKQRQGYLKTVWYKIIEHPKPTLIKAAEGSRFLDLFDKEFIIYRTAFILEPQVFSLGLAREFFTQFEALLKEKNVLCLDDSNNLLYRIIAGSDAPFVYEKLGVRYENFLLDEFQDTSNIQWENFLPLLKESEGNGKKSLIVGDVKQSIYRWRDSDWRLLADNVEKEFPTADVSSLHVNRRSFGNIVSFNNDFFAYASKILGLEDLYADVEQEICREKGFEGKGHVQVTFCDKDCEIDAVVDSVRTARDANANYSDIAVLVRNNAEGGKVAERLIAEGYPVISDDSLQIKSSFIVRKLISLMSCLDNPKDSLNGYIASDAKVTIPSEYHSLVDLCEQMLRQMKNEYPEAFRNETLFIQAFMDTLREWTEVNGNNLRYFLKFWEEEKRYISSPKNSDAITVITIHKAKGLEFAYLIFPFAENVNIFKPVERWCWLDASGTPLDAAASGIYLVNLSESSQYSLFASDYQLERRMQLVDNMNVFYVALTRAKCCLHVIACNPPEKKDAGKYTNFSQILYEFCGSFSEREYGTMFDFYLLERETRKGGEDFPAEYASIDPDGRLTVSEDASDFFGPEGVTGMDASVRRSGIVLHGILSGVKSPEDLPGAVEDALSNGSLDSAHAEEALQLLSKRIAAHPEFFDGAGYNEAAVYDRDGSEYRPDRVVIKGGSATVIDYKFGTHEDRYARQVGRYMRLYRAMGYSEVKGYIWYVPEDELVPVQ